MGTLLTVWILVSVPHSGKADLQPQQYLGVYASQAACEHMLTALSDPTYQLPQTKAKPMLCIAEEPQS
jgi:hypothetical protein